VPIFRSENQARILAALFAGTRERWTVGDLAGEADVPQPSVSRELARLAEAGIVITEQLGRNLLVSPNWDLPWAPELRAILAQTVGVAGQLAEVLRPIRNVEGSYIFGSWAARIRGDAGPFPADVDLLVVGDPTDRTGLDRTLLRESRRLRIDVNPLVVTPSEWEHPEPGSVLDQIKRGPLVKLDLGEMQ
jgi:DNA-binding transcriptional ArsR family regulator